MFIYYVYAYLREDGSPYYIGKGKNNRAFRRNVSDKFQPPSMDRIKIIASELSEDDAFKIESEYISLFGRKNNNTGILRNLTNGGEGASGAIRSEEFKAKLRVPKSEEWKQKVRKPKPQSYSLKLKEKWQDPEYRNHQIVCRKQFKHSNGSKEKIGIANSKRIWSIESKTKCAMARSLKMIVLFHDDSEQIFESQGSIGTFLGKSQTLGRKLCQQRNQHLWHKYNIKNINPVTDVDE